MKTAYSQFLLCCMIFCGLFTLSNCNDGCDEAKKIAIVDLNRNVPYLGNDTLRFLRNSTDTQMFVGQGLERFYVTTKKQEDDACPEDYESVRIRFKNTQNNDEIKMEYVYQPSTGVTRVYKFYFKNVFVGDNLDNFLMTYKINEYVYDNLGLFALSQDTLSYLIYRYPLNNQYSGILKIKYPGDTLTIIR